MVSFGFMLVKETLGHRILLQMVSFGLSFYLYECKNVYLN